MTRRRGVGLRLPLLERTAPDGSHRPAASASNGGPAVSFGNTVLCAARSTMSTTRARADGTDRSPA